MIDLWKNRTPRLQQYFWRAAKCLVLLLALVPAASAQINISANGQWDYTVSNLDITEAGTDFQGTYSSAASQVTIDVFQDNFWLNLLLAYNWQVSVRMTQIDWNPNLILSARRTGNGNPFFFNGPISGGTSYLQLSTANQNFFNGQRSRYDIPIQYRISGISVLLPAKTYTATVVYTVTEL